jgi:hypothetical protein
MTASLAVQDYPVLNLFWTMLIIALWVLWFILLFWVITDIFRSHDLSGWGKAAWLIGVILLPFVGVLIYVVVRGEGIGQRPQVPPQADQEVPAVTSRVVL